ncbi:MAG: YtxH domain-containing protein [Bryobacteraceae bacterium]
MERDDAGMGLAWFLVGAAVGASVALLYAPKSGEETRRYLSRKTEQSKETLVDSSRDLVDRGKELYDRGREMADDAADIFERGRKLVRG